MKCPHKDLVIKYEWCKTGFCQGCPNSLGYKNESK